ncbi:hypothetical protein CcCBS67573_g01189 [Chytriomyces confervae]|uniref:Small monomeric GTPase n=1 Tax=Chytriomyces confervae TaxID=246404 RepID=A0A507FRF2_9FUNG|nr:GTP-binding protein Rho1 [Chytriomyces hyalinus]TPX77547.1 hypothetical protein CcCBS67573_g01189 [Chytriomyces confervae]
MDPNYAPLIPAQKVVVVGDGACGKTSLLNVLIRGVFPEMYEPTIVEVEDTSLYVDGHSVTLNLWDTTGQEEYDRLRSLAYGGNTSAVLIAFAVDSPTSLENVETLWFPEVAQYCPNVPIFLVALKKDLRNDAAAIAELARTNMTTVSESEGRRMAERIGAKGYFECCAKVNEGVHETFQGIARVTIKKFLPAPQSSADTKEEDPLCPCCVIL